MEPEIVINGVKIDYKCAHTIKLALFVLEDQLDKGVLGDTEGAKIRSQKYLVRIGDIMELMRKDGS